MYTFVRPVGELQYGSSDLRLRRLITTTRQFSVKSLLLLCIRCRISELYLKLQLSIVRINILNKYFYLNKMK
jgi:hypothetical protein